MKISIKRYMLIILLLSLYGLNNCAFADIPTPGEVNTTNEETLKYLYQAEQATKDAKKSKKPPVAEIQIEENQPPTDLPPKIEEKIDAKTEEITPAEKIKNAQTATQAEQTKPAVEITTIELTPSTILSNEEINIITTKYVHKKLTIEEINQMVSEINGLYKQKDYYTARAFVPPQRIEGGVLKIELIEGKIGTVKIEGNKWTRDTYIQKRLTQKKGETLNVKQLEKDLVKFNRDNQNIALKARLQAGKNPGETDVIIIAEDRFPFHLTPSVDNAGRESIGMNRFGAAVSADSLLGYRDKLTVGGMFGQGSRSAYGAYSLPLGTKGTRLNTLYSYSNIDVINGPLSNLGVKGNSFDLGLGLSRPFYDRGNVKITGIINGHSKSTKTLIDDFKVQDTPIWSVEYGATIEEFDRRGATISTHLFSNGIANDSAMGNNSFFKYSGNVYRMQNLPKDFQLIVRGNWQFGTKDMPVMEQFQLGGLASVRGYQSAVLLGDSGYFASAELLIPFLPQTIKKYPTRNLVKLALFVDNGAVFNADSAYNEASAMLTSIGAGLRFNFSKYLIAGLYYGFGLQNTDKYGDNKSSINFMLQTTPF